MLTRKLVPSLLLVTVSAVPVAASNDFDEKDALARLEAAIISPEAMSSSYTDGRDTKTPGRPGYSSLRQ